jgi:creatinine amidohydrolase
MRLWDANWMQVEEYLRHDDRVLVPLGSTEQHGYLSLGVDAILCELAAAEAAEPLGVPVLPALPFGLTPSFTAYPGTINLREATYLGLVRDVIDSLLEQGFRRILLVNGHGGNLPAERLADEYDEVRFHNWLIDPAIWGLAAEIDDVGHASWVENHRAVRLAGVAIPAGRKPVVAFAGIADPDEVRALLGDGPSGGPYQRPDEDTQQVWKAAVELLRERLRTGWSESGERDV